MPSPSESLSPNPLIKNLNGFSSKSSLTILIIAFLCPNIKGLKVTVKEVLPPAGINSVVGFELIANSLEPRLRTSGFEIARGVSPLFSIINVFDTLPIEMVTLPKFVLSVILGVVSPFKISIEFPLIFISAGVP